MVPLRNHLTGSPPRRALLGTFLVGALVLCIAAGLMATGKGTPRAQEQQSYLPIVRAAPVWPQKALAEGLEGRVVVEFTVTAAGGVQDLAVIESSDPMFEQPALRAVERFKYLPRMQAGRSVEVPGVRVIFEHKYEPPLATLEELP